ncbi:MAG TPA: M48 family metalloprotease [Thermoanaerobaculia bacterium]|nr:M48 family metalloprotease [Thermoanaerobaculia bacterium]
MLGQAGGALDLGSLLRARDPATMIGGLKEDMQEKVKDRWTQLVMEDSQTALTRNRGGVLYYPNPSLQAYVNRLGQSLIPKEASENIFVSFKIIEDPLPYADTLATGTVYLSTGMISLLDNESQLAFLLMHEAGHVMLSHNLNQIIEEEKAEKRANRIRLIGVAAGALAGGIVGGSNKDAGIGSLVGLVGADVAIAYRAHRFMRQIQLESDQFATQVLLQHGFDAREAPTLMAKVGDIVRRSGAAVELAFGDASDLPERSAKVKELLGGPYQPVVARILNGDGFRMSSPRYSQLMSELKRDNGLLAFERDLFIIARANLEEAAAVRTDDPLTMYGLGVLYRTVGRTDEDVARAAGYLKSAMEFDEVRHRFPEAYLQYAVELLSREDPQRYPEIQKTLKNYVVLYQRNSGGNLPREMRFVYDYLDLTGDRNWIAYNVDNVSSEAPYQLTGDAKIDGTVQAAEKRSPKK